MRISRITIGRLFNLGSYEHMRYELSVEIPKGESAAKALLAIERILNGLKPTTHTHSRDELNREAFRNLEMRKLLRKEGVEVFRQRHGHFEGTPLEYIRRCEESHRKSVKEREKWESKCDRARRLLDDLGGASRWKDAKLDWETDDDF